MKLSGTEVTIAAIGLVIVGGFSVWWFYQGTPAGANPSDPSQVALGKDVYVKNCASCHGINLEGQNNWRRPFPDGKLKAPPHDASGHTWHHTDKLLFDYTKLGGQALIGGDFQSGMPGFKSILSDAEIWAVLAYIKSTWPGQIRERQENLNRSQNPK